MLHSIVPSLLTWRRSSSRASVQYAFCTAASTSVSIPRSLWRGHERRAGRWATAISKGSQLLQAGLELFVDAALAPTGWPEECRRGPARRRTCVLL